ncbi:MAG TPA: LysE family transporter [bacterium]|nr:LysE family transporter [bacterium]
MYIVIAAIIGFIAAIPIGPINVYAITQTMKRDFTHGFLAGLTSALLDVIFCFAAIAGTHHLTSRITELLPYIKLLGVIIILSIAFRLLHQARHFIPIRSSDQPKVMTALRPIIGAMLLYLTNPSLYMFWLAVGGTISAHRLVSPREWSGLVFALMAGVGTTLWYLLLCRYVAKYHHQFSQSTFARILRFTALILILLALYTAVTLVI